MKQTDKSGWNMQTFLHELEGFLARLSDTGATTVEWEGDKCGFRIHRKGERGAMAKLDSMPHEGAATPEKFTVQIGSPVVGVFHFPSKKPQKGGVVKEGKELGFVEAINVKHFLEIEQPGTVLEVHAVEGQPVGFGDLLFTLAGHVS